MRPSRLAGPASPRAARALTLTYGIATVVALVLVLLVHRASRPGLGELVFSLLNVPVAPSFVSLVVLALTTRALVGRKRTGLWLVAAFQVVGVGLGLVALVPRNAPMIVSLWRTHGAFGRGVDIAGIGIGLVALWWLRRLRGLFPGRLQRGSWSLALSVLLVGVGVTVGVTWLLLGGTHSPRGQLDSVVDTVLAAFGGVSHRTLFQVPEGVVQATAGLSGATILAAVGLFYASSKPRNRWSPDREVDLRALLVAHGARDSLGYFATRRDKASVFSPDRRAAVTYRVLAGVSLASADPIGDPASWAAAISSWRAEAQEYGWQPGVLAASEAGAQAYAAAGLQVVLIGDEAVLDPAHFDLRTLSKSTVRHAVQRAKRAGVSVRIRRQGALTPDELHGVVAAAHAWLGRERDRGFSMALGRTEDPVDDQILYVTAHDLLGELVGVLGFVPWGPAGVSLDVMRRSPTAPNGTTELMISELMVEAERLGLRRVSLNFCMFRGIFEESARIGGRSLTKLNASVLGLLDRFWQLERLYRANEKYEPSWLPRFLCYDDPLALPQVALAAGAAEGFVPWPHVPSLGPHRLDPDHQDRIHALPQHVPTPSPRRSDQSRHRLAVLERIRDAGLDPYPAATAAPASLRDGAAVVADRADSSAPLTDLFRCAQLAGGAAGTWPEGRQVSVVGRVRAIRDHGGVVFVTLVDGAVQVQALLDAACLSQEELCRFTDFVAAGDLLRVSARTGWSHTGTPSLLVSEWALQAKSLQAVPFRGLADAESRLRQRSLDLIVNPAGLDLLRHRALVVSSVRDLLTDRGYLEVETPILQTVHGGASARPFETHSNAYGVDLSLRIAPELFLKRLVVGGLGPLFELGRNFRNEGADATHNPEFTSLEVYRPHGDYVTMRHLAEDLVKGAARALHGRAAIPLPPPDRLRTGLQGIRLVDIEGPWQVTDLLSAVSRAVGRTVTVDTDIDVLLGLAARNGIEPRPDAGPGTVIEDLYTHLVEPATVEPTFYVDFPLETSPLTRPHRHKPGLVERWDLVIAGMEVGTAYTELTDPVDQRSRLTEQSLRAAAGDPEAMAVDEDFLAALEIGMPPTGGLGIGIDRLVMLLTNTPIRSIVTFPFVRPRRPTTPPEEPRWS
jgi:lysyl-tRNA synthetase class 2